MGAKRERELEENRQRVKAYLALEYERITGQALPIDYITRKTVGQLRALLKRVKVGKPMKPTEYTVIPGLLAPVNSEQLVELNSDTASGGDWYAVLRDVEVARYYVALNGQIFLVTFSDVVAYNIFYQSIGKQPILSGRFTTAALNAIKE